MTTQELADQLVKKLKEGDFFGAYDFFDQENVKHFEPKSPVESFRNITGVEALKKKDEAMGEGIAEASLPTIGEPIVKPNAIALPYKMELKLKDGNELVLEAVYI